MATARADPLAFQAARGGPVPQRESLQRRLVAIAHADVVGYSRLMSKNEDRTVARWLAIQHDVIEPKSRAYRGRLVDVIGGYIGSCHEAIRYAERGLRLSPYDRSLYCSYFFLTLAYYGAGAGEQTIKWRRMFRSENPYCTATLRILAAALAEKQDFEQRQEVVQALLYLEPDFSIGHYANTRQPFCEEDIKKRYSSHLQGADIPVRTAAGPGRTSVSSTC
jgi:hypothetical protein